MPRQNSMSGHALFTANGSRVLQGIDGSIDVEVSGGPPAQSVGRGQIKGEREREREDLKIETSGSGLQS